MHGGIVLETRIGDPTCVGLYLLLLYMAVFNRKVGMGGWGNKLKSSRDIIKKKIETVKSMLYIEIQGVLMRYMSSIQEDFFPFYTTPLWLE